jgi:hypothetical protein
MKANICQRTEPEHGERSACMQRSVLQPLQRSLRVCSALCWIAMEADATTVAVVDESVVEQPSVGYTSRWYQ